MPRTLVAGLPGSIRVPPALRREAFGGRSAGVCGRRLLHIIHLRVLRNTPCAFAVITSCAATRTDMALTGPVSYVPFEV